MSHPRHLLTQRRRGGFSLVEISISVTLLSLMFWLALSSYTGSMRGTTVGTAQLEAMANSSKALIAMNLELQEASVRDETVEIWPIDADNTLAAAPVDAATTPPPGTLYPTTQAAGNSNYGIRFMTIGGFVNVGGNSMEMGATVVVERSISCRTEATGNCPFKSFCSCNSWESVFVKPSSTFAY